MFLLSFTLSLAIYTIWLNAPLGMMISAGVLGILLLVCGWKRQRKQCGRIFAGNLLALLLISGNLLRRNTDDGSKDDLHSFRYGITPPVSSSPTFEDKPTPTQRETFNGFGTIIDTQKYHVYLFEDEKGNVRRLSSKQTYHIGDQLFLSASLLRLQLQKVFNANFIPPRTAEFWDYQFNYDKRIFMKGIAGTAYEKQSILVNPQHP
ncbi:MAG: hypothetical protein LBP53_08735 [Candidatus Peribacteria bacterium]|jgi:hypothetical protein|nr:hypothetical protein [Candidatus Peribacteria bacterium]